MRSATRCAPLAEAQEAATAFLAHYRRYAKVAAKRKAAGPRLTQRPLRAARPGPRRRRGGLHAAQRQLDDAQRELTELEEQRTGLEARQKALEADPAMRDAERLKQLREDADRKEKAAHDREADRDRQAGHVTRYADKATQTAHRAGTGRDSSPRRWARAAATAADAGCAQRHRAAVAALDGTGLESTGPDAPLPAERVEGVHRAVDAYLDAPEAPAADILARARRDAQDIADRQAQAVAQLGRTA